MRVVLASRMAGKIRPVVRGGLSGGNAEMITGRGSRAGVGG